MPPPPIPCAAKAGGRKPAATGIRPKAWRADARRYQESAFRVAAVALAFRHLRLGLGPAVGRERSADIDRLAELSAGFAPDEAFVACMGLDEFALAGGLFWSRGLLRSGRL